MRPFARTGIALVLGLTLGGPAWSQTGGSHGQHGGAIHTPDQLQWKDGPPSLPAGAQFVVIEGDPAKKGEYFAFRLRLPDGYRIPPHWHPVYERVTVLSGTFHLGQGDTFAQEKTQPLPAGSYFTMAPKMRHFARAEGETIVQLTSIGPWEIRYVDPKDDPRKSTSPK